MRLLSFLKILALSLLLPVKAYAEATLICWMSGRKITGITPWFDTEVSNALFKLAVATGMVLDGTICTVTCASHLLTTGDYVTFSGVTGTGVTLLNESTWGPVTVLSSSSYTFPCTLTGTAAGSQVQEKLYFPPAGDYCCQLGANGCVEYNSNNTWGEDTPTSSSGGDVWRIVVAASGRGSFTTDGISFRFRENGTTATSYFSRAI